MNESCFCCDRVFVAVLHPSAVLVVGIFLVLKISICHLLQQIITQQEVWLRRSYPRLVTTLKPRTLENLRGRSRQTFVFLGPQLIFSWMDPKKIGSL